MAGLALLLFLCTVNNVCQTQLFTALEGSNTFPCAFSSSAAAYNNLTQTVLFFGGSYPCSKQMVQFELQSASFTQYNSTYLNQEMYGNGQHYTQLDDILWVLAVDGTDMYRIDVQTLNVQNASSAIQNVGVGAWACLASMTQYIFVISGKVISTLVQIYDINSNQWLDNVPTLNTKRTASSCVVISNHLYVIGGNFDNLQYLDTIEKLYVGDDLKSLSSQSWQIITDTLMNPMQKMSVAHAAQNIYVVGGMKNDSTVVSNIEIIDTTSDSVLQWGTLHTAVAVASAVAIDNTLFIFAGYTGSSYINTYQYITLPVADTNNPSEIPTNIPSVVPSVFPTNIPSIASSDTTVIAPTNTTNIDILTTFADYNDTSVNLSRTDHSRNPTTISVHANTSENVYVFPSETLATNGCVNMIGCDDDDDGDVTINKTQNKDDKYVYYVIVMVAVVLFSVGPIIACYYLHRRFVMKEEAVDEQNMMEAQMEKGEDSLHKGEERGRVEVGERDNDDVTLAIGEQGKRNGNRLSYGAEGQIRVQIVNKDDNDVNHSDSEELYITIPPTKGRVQIVNKDDNDVNHSDSEELYITTPTTKGMDTMNDETDISGKRTDEENSYVMETPMCVVTCKTAMK